MLPVDDFTLVGALESQGGLVTDVHRPANGKLAPGLDKVVDAQRQMLHAYEVGVALLTNLEDADDVGVSDGGGQTSLSMEPLKISCVPRQVRMHHLESHHLPGVGIPDPVHSGLPPIGDLLQYLVSSYSSLVHSRPLLRLSLYRSVILLILLHFYLSR